MILYRGKRYSSIALLLERIRYEMAQAKLIDPTEGV